MLSKMSKYALKNETVTVKPELTTTFLQRPLFRSLNLGLYNIELPLKNDHLSSQILGPEGGRYTQGWLYVPSQPKNIPIILNIECGEFYGRFNWIVRNFKNVVKILYICFNIAFFYIINIWVTVFQNIHLGKHASISQGTQFVYVQTKPSRFDFCEKKQKFRTFFRTDIHRNINLKLQIHKFESNFELGTYLKITKSEVNIVL